MPAGHDMIVISNTTWTVENRIFNRNSCPNFSFFLWKKNIWNENHKLMLWLVKKCLSNFCQNNSTIFVWSRQDSSATKRNAVKLEHAIFITEEDRRLNTIGNLGSDRRVILISFVSYEGILYIHIWVSMLL